MQSTETPLTGRLGADPAPAPLWRRALEALRRLGSGRRRHAGLDLGLHALPVLDVEAILAELGVRARAVENAAHEIPASTDTALDGPQALLVQHVETSIRVGKGRLEGHLSALTRRIEQTDVSGPCSAALAAPAALARDLDALVARHQDRLAFLRERHRSLRAELDAFRRQRGIRWEPSYPDSHVLHLAVLAAVLCLEAVMNGVYFAEASETGLLGGVTTAATIAAVNVGASFFLGRAAAWLRGSLVSLRAVGALALGVFVLWLVGYNLVVAHARDLLVQGGADPDPRAILDSAVGAPLALRQLNSWLLFLLGGAFSLVALADGLRWDDPNPGYRKRHRRVLEAREEYLELRDRLEAEGAAITQRHRGELAAQADRVRYAVDGLRNDVEQARMLLARAQNFFEYAQGACNTMLSVYRDLNRQHRKSPPPAYFQTRWSHPVPEIFRADRAPSTERLARQDALRRDLETRRPALVQEIEATHARFVARARALRDSLDETPPAPAGAGA